MRSLILHIAMAAIAFPAVRPLAASPQEVRGTAADTLAVLQSSAITARDLLERLELMPWPGKEKKSRQDSIKIKALYALIAEKLLAASFDRAGVEETKDVPLLRKGLDNVLLRDLLYKQAVTGRIEVSEQEILAGLSRYREERDVMVFQIRSSFDGTLLSSRLRGLAGQDSLIIRYDDQLVIRSTPLLVTYGSIEKVVEDAAYALTVRGVSDPVYSSRDGWLVLALIDRRPHQTYAESPGAERTRLVEKVVRRRKEVIRAQEFYYGILAEKRAQADSAGFEMFAAAAEDVWKSDTTAFRKEGLFMVSSGFVNVLLRKLDGTLDRPFIAFEDRTISLGDIIELLRYEEFGIPSLDPGPLRIQLNERIKAMVANDVLALEARKRGLDQTDAFIRERRVWNDYWKSRRLYDVILDSIEISEDELVSYLMDNDEVFGTRFEVNVREVLTRKDGDMKQVLQELAAGRSLESVARERSEREEWKERGGESGFFVLRDHREIGYRALLADSAQLVGPIDLPEGRSLFTPIAKRGTDGRMFDARTFKDGLQKRLLGEKQRKTMSAFVQDLARQEEVAINAEALSRVRMTSVNMFTRRYIGFGGIMTAVPMLSSQWDWLVGLGKDVQVLP
jgi:hypothetical protein